MDLKIAARITAVIALGAAMTAAFMALRGNGSQDVSSPRSEYPGGEPASVELERCRAVGMAAIADEACRKAWAENRRRFLRPSRPVAPYAAPPIEKDQSRLQPLTPSTPADTQDTRSNTVAP
ncbi:MULTISPECIES: putative entry exclusion protein TrbK-alt [Mesorhizobium]|uniref:putative entry exclusion protein TrbK-alt n=1 Tax=Mesorhizobium TaxID=68287 RepID=UPI0009ED7FD8|nr:MULTISPECIES: putative entry exclusion protein TrbK-alt [Mesorhizobium]MDF3233897.1 putative entry exclusion protein TrbK-alt [Mesorhizobium sp. DSM 30133]RUU16427.1 conjugal transfer protein TrbK [Mesorhizobium sp. Primo-B]RUU33996.1 conjugal transfer protein TrbK [Mesorhizobium sp. Primo-A]RVB81194.1 conjugal transfer protein TrbK [Mesorhizobium sp. M7A.F.Ca.AU.002.03.1.1]RVB94961.1 conjugal transfer protein TrbK [Mesorhizobium sp. M7A.F.Ca.AU.002.04.1.1]